jgi:hypothetical protein
MRRNEGSGCLGVILLIWLATGLIYNGIDNWIHSDENEAKEKKEKQEFVNYWKQSNIDFFKTFKCDALYFSSRKFSIEKFYVFATWDKYECDIQHFINYNLKFKNDKIQNRQTQLIKDANVLIMIKQIPGERVGSYEDGSRAILYDSEINFIDIKNKIIFKKIVVKCIGDPPKEIRKKGYTSPSKDILFGTFNDTAISKAIEGEL